MKKNKIIILIVVILLLIGGIYLYFNNKTGSSSNKTTSVAYDDGSYSADFSDYEVTKVNLSDVKNVYSITKKGVYEFTGKLTGYIEINTTENVEIILNGVTITNTNGPCIYAKSAKNLYIKLSGTNTLKDGSSYTGFDADVKGAIYSKDDLIFTGDGTLNLTANYEDGIVSKDDLVFKSGTYNITSKDDAIRGKDSVIIIDGKFVINAKGDGIKSTNETDNNKGYILIQKGTFSITASLDGIEAVKNIEIDDGTFDIKTGSGASINSTNSSWGMQEGNSNKTAESMKGIKAGTDILIKNINLNANTEDDSIHSNSNITIDNGDITILSGDDGIHADNSITTSKANINIKQSYEGIEANKITINSGEVSVVSSDDGLNVNGGSDQSAQGGRPGANNYSSDTSDLVLTINGGTIKVNAGGDGLDSNGSIVITDGDIYVDGPTDNSNGAIDYNDTFKMTGGTLVAAGSSGMAQNISSNSSAYGVIIYFSSTQNAGTKVSIDGILEYTPSKSFSSIVIVSPKFSNGNSYNVSLNGTKYTTFTISGITTSVGTNTSSGGPGQRGR